MGGRKKGVGWSVERRRGRVERRGKGIRDRERNEEMGKGEAGGRKANGCFKQPAVAYGGRAVCSQLRLARVIARWWINVNVFPSQSTFFPFSVCK